MIKKIKFIIFIPFILLSIQPYAQETFLLNYQDVDIAKVTQDISKFSKKTLILDPRVKGRISIFSDSILSAEQVWDVYLRTIQVHGFAALSDGGVVRIVPENEATRDSNKSLSQSSIETKIFTLKIERQEKSSVKSNLSLEGNLICPAFHRLTQSCWLIKNQTLKGLLNCLRKLIRMIVQRLRLLS